MSTFSCPVARVEAVAEHPNADKLSIIALEGMAFSCISAKLADGSPRYKVGDCVVYIPSDAVLPEWLLRDMGFWDPESGKGKLSGSTGDRVKPMRLRGVFSDGVLLSAERLCEHCHSVSGDALTYWPGMDAAAHLGITKWEPTIPAAMAGEVTNMADHLINYDFERWEKTPDLFEPGEQVTATEKLHGTNMCITWVPDLTHEEMFGTLGNIMVSSKGLGAQGLVFKNNPANTGNLYVRTLRDLLSNDFENQLHTLVDVLTERQQLTITTALAVRVWGEVFGQGVQDLHYGTTRPQFAVFDIKIGERWLTDAELATACAHLHVSKVPLAYKGPFDQAALEAVRDGKTMLGGANIREGIVVRSENLLPHPVHGSRIAKMISPDYLVRKAKNATEFQ